MKKCVKTVLGAAAFGTLAAGTAMFLIAPGKAAPEKKAPFEGRNFAHRGLHSPDGAVPENSLPAFRRAVDAGYGIELDVHLSRDGRLVVFHDDTLERMCACRGRVEDKNWRELRSLTLGATQEHMPLLCEVLAAVDGRVPIILEIKRGGRRAELCERTYEQLMGYHGDVCIESFDPLIVRWWRKNAPDMLRGQLSCTCGRFGPQTGRVQAFALSRLLTNFLCRPQFIAYGICERKPLTVRICEALGAMRVAWTSRGWGNEEKNDTVIFEYYRPRIRFR